MTHIIFHTTSTMEYRRYPTEKGAKTALTRLNKKQNNEYSMADIETYRTKVVKKVKVTNLMSGKEIEIDSNTPACCDPSSEHYWSM